MTTTITSNNGYEEIKQHLDDAVKSVEATLEQLKQQQEISTKNILLENSTLNINANTFSLNTNND